MAKSRAKPGKTKAESSESPQTDEKIPDEESETPAEVAVKAPSAGLDETVIMSDPLTAEEREALTRVRQHEADVAALRASVTKLRQKSSQSAVELRQLCDEAKRVEALLGLDAKLLSREALRVQAEWPTEILRSAGELIAAVDACEAATQKAREQISIDEDKCEPDAICERLETLLSTFSGLQKAQRDSASSPLSRVDLGVDARASAVGPLADALLDKAVEVHEKLQVKAPTSAESFASKIRTVLAKDVASQSLKSLRVEVPSHELFQSKSSGGNMVSAASTVNPSSSSTPSRLARAGFDVTEKPKESTTVAESPSSIQASLEDPLLRTTPGLGSASFQNGAAADEQDLIQLWHAVHIGDEETLKILVSTKVCNGRIRDAHGHSILWHAIAFNHLGLAEYMMNTFPPGTSLGVEVDETHHRKGDTLLHLLCMSRNFGKQVALLFKRIAAAAPPSLFHKVNLAGYTFFQIAAASLNFWVLNFMLTNYQEHAKELVCSATNPALRSCVQVIPHPTPPVPTEPDRFPEYFRIAQMLQQDETGVVPYADVAFDVGPEKDGVASGRFLAHRIVVVAQSPVLFEALNKLELTDLPREQIRAAVFRVDERISQEVWRSVLQFMYTGMINEEAYSHDISRSIELLRACVLYKLPKPLLDFAQCCLYPLLPVSPAQAALQVFSLCSGTSTAKDEELRPVRDASAYILMRSAHKLFELMESQDACPLIQKLVQSVEQSVFNPSAAAQQQLHQQQLEEFQLQQQQHFQDSLSQSISFSTQGLDSFLKQHHIQQGVSQDVLSQSVYVPRVAVDALKDTLSDTMARNFQLPQAYGRDGYR